MIKINNLTKKYKEKYAVNNLNLEIKSDTSFNLIIKTTILSFEIKLYERAGSSSTVDKKTFDQ